MKVSIGSSLRRGLAAGALLAVSVGLAACGDSSSDPDVVTLEDLKPATSLQILDLGNGSVRLSWTGLNNEDDFSGYNIYGKLVAEPTTDSVKAKEGQTLRLMKDDGTVDSDVKTMLATMSYNGTDWETVGTKTDPEAEIEYYPYYATSTAEAEPITPSCQPASTVDTTGKYPCNDTVEGQEDPDTLILNGSTYKDLSGLKIGSTYCFVVVSTLDGGDKIPGATSEVRCVVPRGDMSATFTAESGKYIAIDFKALREQCAAASSANCGDLTLPAATAGDCDTPADTTVCIELFSSKVNFTAGKSAGIQDLEYSPTGFAKSLTQASEVSSYGTLQNVKGYSLAGQSLPALDDHVYVVAEGDRTATTPDSFYYHQIYYTADSSTTGAGTIQVRVSTVAGDRQ